LVKRGGEKQVEKRTTRERIIQQQNTCRRVALVLEGKKGKKKSVATCHRV